MSAVTEIAADDDASLHALANEFLDLWQANLLAWATDPAFLPALPGLSGKSALPPPKGDSAE